MQLTMLGGPIASAPPMGCYRTVDSTGADIAGADVPHQISQDLATKMYSTMAALQTVDTVFYEAQRQVSIRLLFYWCHTCSICKTAWTAVFLADAGKILILHDKRRRGSHSCGFCCSLEPGRHCKQLLVCFPCADKISSEAPNLLRSLKRAKTTSLVLLAFHNRVYCDANYEARWNLCTVWLIA